jgi:Domain of unknown function (DUF4260)
MQGATTGGVRIILRLEGLGVMILAFAANARWGMSWGHFALFFFAPDLSFLGYLAGPKVGAAAYNTGHAYLGGMICIALGLLLAAPILLAAGILWFAHIGFDRALGYGLKYSTGFGFTHLGPIGKQRSA